MIRSGRLKKIVALIVLDGWGISEMGEKNLISKTKTPRFDRFVETYPSTVLVNPLDKKILLTSGEDACRLSHYMIGTSKVENDIKALEKINPLSLTSLAKVISQKNLKQLYLTDVEKFPQVSYFYRGCFSKLFDGEKQVICGQKIIKKNSTKPQLHIKDIYSNLKKELSSRKTNFIFINLSNIDIVSHTGDEVAVSKAIKSVDKYLGLIVDKILGKGGDILILADHGCGEKFSQNMDSHTASPVPLIMVGKKFEGKSFPKSNLVGTDLSTVAPAGYLTDIAPTILSLLNLQKPKEMIGKNLI